MPPPTSFRSQLVCLLLVPIFIASENSYSQTIHDQDDFIPEIPPISEITTEQAPLPYIGGRIKDVIFDATNAQYVQITSRLTAIRAGAGSLWQAFKQESRVERQSKGVSPPLILSSREESSRWDLFVSASGVFAKLCGVNEFPKTKSMLGYFNVGADYFVNQYAAVGVYGGYQRSRSWDHYYNGSWALSNGVKFGLYGTAQYPGFSQRSRWTPQTPIIQRKDVAGGAPLLPQWTDDFYVNAILGGAVNCFNMTRTMKVWKRHWVARSNPPTQSELDSLLGLGYELNINSWTFGINNSFQYTYFSLPAYNESRGRELNVSVNRQNVGSLIYTAGVNISYLWEILPNYKLFPTVGLSWQHEFLNNGNVSGSFANGRGNQYSFSTSPGTLNYAYGVAGLAAQIGRWGIYGYYTSQFGGGENVSHGALVGINYLF